MFFTSVPSAGAREPEIQPHGPPVLLIASGKGGTGKTVVCTAVGHLLCTEHQRRVVLCDLDPQASLTTFWGLQASSTPLDAESVAAFGMHVYAGGVALSGAHPEEVAAHVQRARRHADVVLVDVRGTLDDAGHTERLMRLPGVRVLAVPAAEPRSVPELAKLVERARVAGAPVRILINRLVRRRPAYDVVTALRDHYGTLVLDAVVPERADVQRAELRLLPVSAARPNSPVTAALRIATTQLVSEGIV